MYNKNQIRLFLSFLLFGSCMFSQDIHFSQYAELQSNINPALAGTQYDTRATAIYRNQWSTVGVAYQTYGVGFEQTIKRQKLKSNYFTASFNMFRDQAGNANMTNLSPNLGLAYSQRISRYFKLSAGLQGGIVYRTINASNLRWDSQYDYSTLSYNSSLPTGEPIAPASGVMSYDLGGGFNFHYAKSQRFISAQDGSKFNFGFSAYHYGIPNNSFIVSSEKLYARYCVYFSGDFNLPNTKNAIMPTFIYQRQGTNNELILGALYKFIIKDESTITDLRKAFAFAIGVQYRYKDAVIPTALLQYYKYAFGISYDVNVSTLTPASRRYGAVEFLLRYNVSQGYGKNLGRSDTKASY
ncbi:MAG: PorP/SprF family type IX secretion system membrane protein [Bacteroidetes bacterium]|nr:PorP/SprF family type IX secretion system membrane protein [Bacteroidota bacterium]